MGKEKGKKDKKGDREGEKKKKKETAKGKLPEHLEFNRKHVTLGVEAPQHVRKTTQYC